MKYFLFVILFTLKISYSYCQIAPMELQADSLFHQEKYNDAIELYDAIIKTNPTSCAIYLKRGDAYFMKKKMTKALYNYGKAIELDSTNGNAYLARSIARFKIGSFTSSIKDRESSEFWGVAIGTKEVYLARNGIKYAIGDSIKIGKGSATNGSYKFLLNLDDTPFTTNINSESEYTLFTIDNIKRYVIYEKEVFYFTISKPNLPKIKLKIEDAITSCEVLPCKNLFRDFLKK